MMTLTTFTQPTAVPLLLSNGDKEDQWSHIQVTTSTIIVITYVIIYSIIIDASSSSVMIIISFSTPLPRRNTSHISPKFSISPEVIDPSNLHHRRHHHNHHHPNHHDNHHDQPGECRARADSEHLMPALGLDPDLYKVLSKP